MIVRMDGEGGKEERIVIMRKDEEGEEEGRIVDNSTEYIQPPTDTTKPGKCHPNIEDQHILSFGMWFHYPHGYLMTNTKGK